MSEIDPTKPAEQYPYTPYPHEPTGTAPYVSYNHPYTSIPPPPPEWKPKRHSQYTILSLLVICIILGGGILVWLKASGIPTLISTKNITSPVKSTSHPTVEPTIEVTPTLDAAQALQSTNFDTFLSGFSQAAVKKQYDIVSGVADTNNFQLMETNVHNGGGGGENWKTVHDALISGYMSFIVHYPARTPEEMGYNCSHHNGSDYGPHGFLPFIAIANANVQYAVGTILPVNASDTANQYSTRYNTDGTVFIFEQLIPPDQISRGHWLWRGYVTNNIYCPAI